MDFDIPAFSVPSSSFFNAENESPLMDKEALDRNVALISRDAEYLADFFQRRIDAEESTERIFIDWPELPVEGSPYAVFCKELLPSERALLLFSLLPHFAPEYLSKMAEPVQQGLVLTHPHVGGYIKRTSFQFIPSLQTILFACAGTDKGSQQLYYRELLLESSLLKRQIIRFRPFDSTESVISEKELIPEIAEEYVQFLLQGRQPRPDFGRNFPAKLLTTDKTWDQLVLRHHTAKEIELLIDWIDYGQALASESKGYFGPGYPALFFGPPGTGKSMTAALIGKRCGLNVFRVDASRIVSKYIGETEKNLVLLFQRMKLETERTEKKPILFFDEADVLFSKRTEVKDAKDKWANMETSVLLPLIEEYEGLAIIATNIEHNIDVAMDRRFQMKIKFPYPSYEEKILLWQKGLPAAFNYPNDESVTHLARYRLSPASIINILKGGCLQAKKRNSYTIIAKDLEYYIRLEFAKSGLTPSWEGMTTGLVN